MLVIIDYGLGNLASVLNMFKKIGVKDVVVSGEASVINTASKLLLPGVGAFDAGMMNLENSNLIPVLNKKVIEEKIPILGICLGMQLLTKRSDEGIKNGLGWIDAETTKFDLPPELKLKVPHMGWNYIKVKRATPLLDSESNNRFYFVHSYFVKCNDESQILATSNFGGDFTISLVFLPLLLVLKTKEVNATRDKLILGLGTLFGILFCLSSLFKVMHWPGANIMWLTALGVLLLLFVPIYFFTGIRNPETKVNTIVTTIIIIAAGGMLFTLTSLKSGNSSRFVQTYNYLQEESFLDMMKQFPKNDSTYHNTELKQLSDTIHASCNKIKAMIIYDGIGRNNIPNDFEARDLCLEDSELGDKFNSGQEGEKLLSDLKNKIKMYNALVTKNFDSQKNTRPISLPNEINKLLIAHSKHLVVTNFNILFAINKIQTVLVGNEIK